MTTCEELGRWAAGLALADVPERVAERARIQTTAVMAAGAAGAQAAAPFAARAPGGLPGEVYSGAAASIAHDWDDYLFMGHTGHSSVWTARAFSPDDTDRALRPQIAGNEVAGRLGAALFLGPHNGQFWSSIHCGGAAAAAGVALGLDAERMAHALAIALYQPPYGLWPGFMGPATKLLTAAEPAGGRRLLDRGDGAARPAGRPHARRHQFLDRPQPRRGAAGRPPDPGGARARVARGAPRRGRRARRPLRVRHDWELTLRTARGPVDAGASTGDVRPAAWLRVARRARELGMVSALDGADLRALLRDRRLRRELLALASHRGTAGLDGIDTARMRMTFPCRLQIRLRSGRTVEIEGDEPGSCGRPLEEQRAVVERKCELAGLEPENLHTAVSRLVASSGP